MSKPSDPHGSLLAIVPAAGIGARAVVAGAAEPIPKQYHCIAGKPMLRRTVEALLADGRIARVLVAVSDADDRVAQALDGLPRTRWLRCGGATRFQTVANALAASDAADDDWTLVHDAARPGLPAGALGALIDACLPDAVGGLLALPVADTLKVATPADALPGAASDAPRVARTLSREHLWQAQTPQMFRAGLLAQAFAHASRAGLTPTDEAGAVEALGLRPLLVPGSLANLKITWPQDFEWMEKWLN